MDLITILGVFVLSSTLALAGASGIMGLAFYAMGAAAARQRVRSR